MLCPPVMSTITRVFSLLPALVLLTLMQQSCFVDGSCSNCDVCNIPLVDASSIRVIYTVEQGDNGSVWQANANISWDSPSILARMYAVRLISYSNTAFCHDTQFNPSCLRETTHRIVDNEYYVENNILFGYFYTFEVGIYDNARNMISSNSRCLFRISGPDCYEETRDDDFCRKLSIPESGKPVNVSVGNFIAEEDPIGTITVTATITWGNPVQVNMNAMIRRYTLSVYVNETTRIYLADPAISYVENRTHVYVHTVSDLNPDADYYVEIRPIITGTDDMSVNMARVFFTTSPTNTPSSTPSPPTTDSSGPTLPTNPNNPTVSDSVAITIAVLVSVSLLLISIIGIGLFYARQRRTKLPNERMSVSLQQLDKVDVTKENPDEIEVEPVFKAKEIDHHRVDIIEELGSGQFGKVYRGQIRGLSDRDKFTLVAVKTVKETASRNMMHDFLNEIRLMLEIGNHPNILDVLACCTVKEPYYMITELLQYGDLLHFLRKCNKDLNIQRDRIYNLTNIGRYQIARQIAKGMTYISTQRYYHGDLAARNILVGKNLLIKISDFGMSCDIYQKGYQRLSTERPRPVKWASLETNLEGKCTIKSDVWSYGIVLYEIFTNGQTPYPQVDPREVTSRLREGYRMSKPTKCPQEVYDIMRKCWHESPTARPNFPDLLGFFDKKLSESGPSEYLDMSSDDTKSSTQKQFEGNLKSDESTLSRNMAESAKSGDESALSGEMDEMELMRTLQTGVASNELRFERLEEEAGGNYSNEFDVTSEHSGFNYNNSTFVRSFDADAN